MSRSFLLGFGATVIVIATLAWFGYSSTRGNHLEPTGKIGKVRTQKLDDNVVAVIYDFKVKNDSDRGMIVRSAEARIEMPDGTEATGLNLAVSDAPKIFAAYPGLGEQFNKVLPERGVIPPHSETDWMILSRFEFPADKIDSRKRVTLTLEDITGPKLVLEAK